MRLHKEVLLVICGHYDCELIAGVALTKYQIAQAFVGHDDGMRSPKVSRDIKDTPCPNCNGINWCEVTIDEYNRRKGCNVMLSLMKRE